MTYEQAKELENAGFPQGRRGAWIFPPDQLVARSSDRVYAPSLEELIEACGDKLGRIVRNLDGSWTAYSECPGEQSSGSAPTEAVLRLWLALHREEK
jgi:hypothetical protein